MIWLFVSCGWLAVVALLILRAWRQQRAVPPLVGTAPPEASGPRVCVVVPARNEAANIGSALRALLEQRSVLLEILVVDDHSDDSTADIVRDIARAGDGRIRLIHAPPLPTGWTGKSHACWSGACQVSESCSWLIFMDADVRAVDPQAISRAIATAEAEELGLVSLAPMQELQSFAERVVIPCGLFLQAFLQDFRLASDPASPVAFATGQFMLFARRTYFHVGGHACARRDICEDAALARCVKRGGQRVALRDGGSLLRAHMYDCWAAVRAGFAKNLVDMIGGPFRTAAVAVLAVLLAWAAPALPLTEAAFCFTGAHQACLGAAPAALASLALLGLHMAGAAHLGVPFWYGALFPLGYSAGAIIAADSLRWRLSGRIRWKGRVYG